MLCTWADSSQLVLVVVLHFSHWNSIFSSVVSASLSDIIVTSFRKGSWLSSKYVAIAVLEEGGAEVGGWTRTIIDHDSFSNLFLAPSRISDAEDEVDPVGDGGELLADGTVSEVGRSTISSKG